MSQYMQINIRIIPIYDQPFAVQFPRIAALLVRMSHRRAVEQEVSLYEMADILEAICRSPDAPSDVRTVLDPYAKKVMGLKEAARDNLLARRLNDLDQLLYRMEDVFEDLERALV